MAFYATVIFSILITLIYWLEKKELKAFFLFWYIVFLPTQKLLPEGMIPIPGFGFEFIFGLSFLFFDLVAHPPKGLFSTRQIYSKIKYAIIILVLQMLFLIYEVLKIQLNGTPSENTPNFFIFTIRSLISLIIFLRIAVYLQDEYYRKLIITALSVGLIFLGVTSFLSPFLKTLGLTISGSYQENRASGETVYRSSGLFRGHPTMFAAFMSSGFGFAFAFFIVNKEKAKKIFFLIVMMSCLLGVLNAAVRAGIFAVVIIILFYIFVEKQNFSSKSFIIFLVIAIGLWLLISFGDYMLYRFTTTEQQLVGAEGNPDSMSRTATWGTHLYVFINNPSIWLYGTWENIIVVGRVLAPHSTPIKFLVYAGIPFFIIFYSTIILLFRYYFKKRDILTFNILYPLFGYLIPSLMNDNYDIRYLQLFLALGLFNPNEIKLAMLAKLHFINKKKTEIKNASADSL